MSLLLLMHSNRQPEVKPHLHRFWHIAHQVQAQPGAGFVVRVRAAVILFEDFAGVGKAGADSNLKQL